MSAASRKPQVPVPSAPVTPAAVVEAPAPAEEEKLQEIVGEVAQEVIPSVAEQQEEAPLPVAPVVAPVAPVAPVALATEAPVAAAVESAPEPAAVEPSASIAEALAAAEAAAASESVSEAAATSVAPVAPVAPAKPTETVKPTEATPKVVKQTKRVVKKVQHRKPVEFSLGAYAKVPLGATVSIGAGSVAPAAAAAAGKSEGAKKEGRRGKKG